jgi:hypothetical protein
MIMKHCRAHAEERQREEDSLVDDSQADWVID